MNNYKFSYDAKKWEEIENSVHKVYSTHPDPRSAEAAYSISNAISDAFPVISRQEAMRNSQQIIENFTGYKLDTQGMWNEFINTAKAQASDLHTSMKFSNAMIAASTQGLDSDAYKLKIQEAMEELNSEELVYRNDFKDMSILTDLLVESGRIVPSMIPTMGIYAAGGALAGVTGGASLIAAKGAGAVFSGMMEAGSVAKELFKIKDSEGNSLNQEYILSAWSLAMAGVGALNLVTDGFEKVTANVAKKIFGKQSIKQLVKSGTVANWGKKISKDYLGKGIAGEAAEEAIEELIGMVASNYVINNSNETEGTLFEGYDKEEIIKTMAQTALSTAKGMVLTGLPSAVISTVQEYNASDTKLKMDANRFTGKNDKSYAVPIIEIKIPGVSFDKDLKKVDSPVKVIQIGNTFKPVDADNATIAASLKYRGAKALNIEVVESSSPFVKESIASARSLSRNKGYEQKNGIILFDDQKTMQEAASEYALSSDTIYGYHEQEGQIILDRKQDDIEHSLVFRTKDFNEIAQKNDPAIDDAGYDPVQEVDPDLEALEAYAETQQELDEKDVLLDEQEQEFKQPEETRRPEEVVKKTYNNLQKQLTKKGATPEEHRFVNDKLLPQIHDALKEKFPDLSEEQIYETAIPSAYFGFVTAKVAGMTTDEFFGKYYTPQAFVALTVKQESDFLNSSAGKKTIQIQTGSNDTGASLSGLTIPKRGKNTIGIASGYTPLTVVHEMGHVMVKVIKDTEQFKPFLEIYKDELGKDGGKIGVNFQEAFAHDLEQYFIDGKVRDSSLKAIFKKIGDGIRELLHLLNPMLDNKTRKAFDKLFDFGLEKTAKADASIKSNVQQEFDFFGDPKQAVKALARVYSLDDANRLRSIGIEEFARRRNLNTHRSEFGAMRPDSVTPGVDPLIEKLAIGMNFIMKHKDQLPADFLDGYANTIKTYEFFKTNATASEDIINEFKEFVKGNLMYLYNKVDDTVKNVTKDWYVGANKLALTWAMEYGYDLENIVGAIANLSPQKDWYQNISLAQRLIDIVKNADKLQWDETMENAISENSDNFATFKLIKNPETGEYILDKNGNLKNYDNHMLVQYIKGKTLGDLLREKDEDSTSDADLEYVTLPASSIKTLKTEAKQREEKIRRLRKIRKHRIAAWIRLYDETHNSKAYRIVNIDGSFGDFMKKEDGTNVDVAWGSFNEIACSFDALTAKDAKTISDSLGDFHKVRNFYNNILVPESENGYVTIDTHAVAAALLIPVSGTGKEVLQNFSSAGAGKVNPSGINPKGSGVYGIHGMYPIYADAYNEVAQELGILPRELQSITWEAVRKLFTEEYKKGKTVVDVAKGKWADYYNKGGDIDATRDAIVKDANEKVGAGATVAEQINGGYGLQYDAVQWRDSYERTLYHDELGNRPGYGGSVARDRDVSALGLPRPGEQDSLGGDGGTDNQGSSGVWSDLENEEILAKVTKQVSLERVKQMLANNEYPSDSDLKAHAGDPDVDWEIQFRRIMVQDIDVYKAFEKALEKANDQLPTDTELTPAKVLEVLEADNPTDFKSMLGEVRDPERFINRLIWQSKFLSPTLADKQFKRDISNLEKLKKIVETILKNRDPGDFRAFGMGPLTQFMSGVKDESKMTGYKIREAKKELLDDLRNYRKMYYENLGLTQQLSYEDTVKGTYLDEGNEVEAFGNEEIRRLLESTDTDPVLKELIRKNLATGDTLQTLVEETSRQIEQMEMEVMDAEHLAESSVNELATKTDELEQTNKKLNHTDKMYKKLQNINTKNYEHMRMQKRMNQLKAKRLQYMKAKQQIEKHINTIDGIINSKSPNNDARMMEALRVSVKALKESTGSDLTTFFTQNGVDPKNIPDQLKQYFTINNAGIFSKKFFSDIDLATAAEMHKAVIDARRDARIEKAVRDMELNREIFKYAQAYAMSARGAAWDDVKTEDRYRTYMAKEKLAGNVQNAKSKYQAFFETKFLTMSRVINKIDPEGNTIKPFLFGGYDEKGVFHRGIEGVLDDEKREEYKRYQSMRQAMDKYGITEKALLEKRVEVTNGSLTLEQAMGVYIYVQQSDALEKLTSPNGNKLVIQRDDQGNVITNEIELVVNSLTDEERAFADWMKDEMGSRWQEISDVYYKVNNKTLGKVANYFPLIRSGEQVVFEDLMQDQFLRMQETPDDSITRARLGGDYELQLNAFSIWNKMVAKQEHYIAGAEFFNKANRLMHKNGGDLYNLIAMNNGKEYANALQDFINRVANKRYIYDDADSLVNKVRSNLVVARLGFNLLTTLKQLPAFGLFAQQFGVGRLFEAIAHMSSDYKGTSEFIYDKSPQMRGHSMSIDFSSFAQMETKTEFGRKVKKIGEVGMTPIQFIDGFIKKTLWYGAYQNNIANGMTDEQASMEATKWINDTQPGGTTKDSAAIYDTNSTIVKYLLMFTNQLNKNMNIVYDIPYAIKNKMYEKAFKNMVGLGLSLAGIVALEGGFDNEDDDDKMWDDLLRNFSSQFISMLPVIGPDVSDIVMDRYYSDSGMPLVSEVYSFTKAIGSGDRERIADRSVNLGLGGAEFIGLPSGQTKKIWDAFTEDNKVNLWYLLGRDFVE